MVDNSSQRKVPAAFTLSVVLAVLAGLGVWWLSDHASPAATPLKAVPQGRVVSVAPLPAYEPRFTADESRLLRDGPEAKNTASAKRYLLLKARLEADPLARRQLEQEAVALTDGYGESPAITEDNPAVRSAVAALRSGKNPERLNPLFAGKPFDAAAYRTDPKAYLDVAEPGRVFQTKAPAAGTPRIEPVSPYWQDVRQGESVAIAVKAVPGYPVTFTSFDSGAFAETGLTTVTVEADAAGIATVHFKGMPGNVLESHILAASPMTSGQAKFKANTLVYTDAPSATR